eukprot:scaffold11_cov140-Skeletonema_menzelii.AAC.13
MAMVLSLSTLDDDERREGSAEKMIRVAVALNSILVYCSYLSRERYLSSAKLKNQRYLPVRVVLRSKDKQGL